MGQFLKSRRAISSVSALWIVVILLIFVGGTYFVWKEGLLGGTTTPTGPYQYFDKDLGITVYFKTRAELDAYVAKKVVPTTGKYPISGTVAIYGNGSAVSGLTVEIYVPASGGNEKFYLWEMVESQTTAATTGAFTTTNGFAMNQRLMIHVVRSATKYTYDKWAETIVGAKAEGLPSAPIGTLWIYAFPLAAGNIALGLYTKTGSAISTAVGTPTSLSKASLASNFEGYVQLSTTNTWSTFGQDPWTQPSTSKKYELREYVTVCTIAVNVTGINWKDTSWTFISVTSGIKRAKLIRDTEFRPAIIATDNSANKRVQIPMWVDLTALADNTGVQVTVVVMDYQLWDTIKENGSVATVGVNFGYTYQKSATFEIKVTA